MNRAKTGGRGGEEGDEDDGERETMRGSGGKEEVVITPFQQSVL